MPEPQLFNPRKRQHLEQRSSKSNGTEQRGSKKQKRSHLSGSQPPAAFWDSLSKIWLTKRALRELNRRNTGLAPNLPRPSRRRPSRPVTRSAVAELRKNRQLTQFAADFLRNCAAGCLKDVKLLARQGGPDLSDLRGYPKPEDPFDLTMSSSQSSSRRRKRGSTSTSNTKPTTITTSTKSTGPYDRSFQQNLIDGGVYPDEYEYPDGRVPSQPDNWEEINQKLAQPRASLSPSIFSDVEFRKFKRADAHAFKEKQITTSAIPFIEGQVRDAKCVSGGISFTNLDHLTNGTLVPGNPDLYYGARPEQLDRRVRDELNNRIVPSTQDDLPIAPNFFLAAKGPDGTGAVARRQACYDGALGARGMHSLLSYRQGEPVYDNNAYTITSTYNDGQLKMYTSHPAQLTSAGSRPEFFMTQIKGWSMTSDPGTFRQGASAFRNARDWTKEKRDEFIDVANRRASAIVVTASAINPSVRLVSSFTSEDSRDELYTTEPLSQESRTSQNTDSNTTAIIQESETSMDELVSDYRVPVKRLVGTQSDHAGPNESGDLWSHLGQ